MIDPRYLNRDTLLKTCPSGSTRINNNNTNRVERDRTETTRRKRLSGAVRRRPDCGFASNAGEIACRDARETNARNWCFAIGPRTVYRNDASQRKPYGGTPVEKTRGDDVAGSRRCRETGKRGNASPSVGNPVRTVAALGEESQGTWTEFLKGKNKNILRQRTCCYGNSFTTRLKSNVIFVRGIWDLSTFGFHYA